MSARPPRPASAGAERGFLFLLAHMRSQSSLLAHLLASHPEIAGHSELHRRYETRADLTAMRAAIEAQLGAPAGVRWLVDKVLHNQLSIDPRILARSDVRAIVLLRRPAASIASMVRMTRTHAPDQPYADPVNAGAYYVDRLRVLLSYEASLAPRLVFVASETLVDAPDETLASLSRWLGLARPLASTYRTFANSGVLGHGDPSEHIRVGRVLNDQERAGEPLEAIEMPPALLDEAQGVYDEAITRFARWEA